MLPTTLALLTTQDAFDAGPSPLLMRHPTANATTVVFSYAGDLWSVPRAGGEARRLTTAAGQEFDPHFSPDGKTIAFSGNYDGNIDVYVMDADGGIPRRLTHHPMPDEVQGWSKDGKSVLFNSMMQANPSQPRLYTVGIDGKGVPSALPLPMGYMGDLSADGQRIAYVPGDKWQESWKRYRGGQTYPIWIATLKDSRWKEIPRNNSNDEQPMWVNNDVYFLSDRDGPVGLYSYDPDSNRVRVEVKGEGFDMKSASAWGTTIAYEKLGSIHLYDTVAKKSTPVAVSIRGDFAEVRPQFKDLRNSIGSASLSPTAQRAVVEARGHILTVPASKGDIRDLFERQGVAERSPAWSPDGRTIAYISDESNSYQLKLYDVTTKNERTLRLGDGISFYYQPVWSPDSKHIAYTDNKKQVWILNVESGISRVVDKGMYEDPNTQITPRWSPDSQWITWARDLDNHLNAVFVHNLGTGKTTQITDALANAKNPIFDRDGKHLYFFASTNTGPASSYLDITSYTNINVVSSVYAIVLSKDGANPLGPESDEETPKPEDPKPTTPPPTAPPATAPPAGAATSAPTQAPPQTPPARPSAPPVKIDFEGISQRILALPMPTAEYLQLEPGTPGTFFAVSVGARAGLTSPVLPSIVKFSLAQRRATPFAAAASILDISANGQQMLLAQGPNLSIVPTAMPPQPGQGALDLTGMSVKIDPRAEWRQMYKEVWRNEKIFFYAPNMHGIDIGQMERRYEPFLANIVTRADLNYLFTDMLGELCIGHMFINGGDIPGAKTVPGGLLGADYTFENGKYKLARVYDGENWNPGLRAPLTAPGVNAKAGEYILEIDGKALDAAGSIYELLEAKANRQVRLKIGPNPDGTGSREVTVVPVSNEIGLRTLAWREDNRRRVEAATGGKVGYVHIPDTNIGGWTNFIRYYYAQSDKQAIIVDDRYNGGGLINDFMVHEMTRTLQGVFTPRNGKDWPTPGAAVLGPKVMITNQWAGSGGDMFPWLFRNQKVGKLIGKRTWGGLVRAFGFQLVDGGVVRAPDVAFFNPFEGTWDVENWGVSPDIDVELDPYLWRQGKDAQLERSIEEITKAMATYPYIKIKKPAYPDKTKAGIRH